MEITVIELERNRIWSITRFVTNPKGTGTGRESNWRNNGEGGDKSKGRKESKGRKRIKLERNQGRLAYVWSPGGSKGREGTKLEKLIKLERKPLRT